MLPSTAKFGVKKYVLLSSPVHCWSTSTFESDELTFGYTSSTRAPTIHGLHAAAGVIAVAAGVIESAAASTYVAST